MTSSDSHVGRYWEMVERLKVTQFYTAPTALRLLLKSGNDYVKKYDRSSIRLLGCGEYTRQRPCSSSLSLSLSVGEPLNDEAWKWYYNVVGEGRCTVVDTWWQTGTHSLYTLFTLSSSPSRDWRHHDHSSSIKQQPHTQTWLPYEPILWYRASPHD